MEFLTILIALGLVQLWGSGGPLQRDEWFYRWSGAVAGFVGYSKLRLVVMVAMPCLVVVFLDALCEGVLFGLLSLLLYVVVLLFSLGRGDFSESVQRYLTAWNMGNFESAYDKALAVGDFRQSDAIGNQISLHEHVRQAVVYEGYQRWFAVVFWFLLLGPGGALGYRLSFLCGRSDRLAPGDRQVALRFVHYLDWIPARLLALSFSLTGNFVNGFNRFWRKMADNMPLPELLETCALAAINSEARRQARRADQEHFLEAGRDELNAVQSLLSRSVICWLIILAVLTVAGAGA